MSTFTLPSGQDHHFRERAFKRSFFVSIGIHVVILVAAGSMTFFRMSGTTYAPSYSVDLVSLPSPKPAPAAKPAPAVKPVPKQVKEQLEPEVQDKAAKSAAPPPPLETMEEMKTSGGDETARLARRKKIEELEMETRRLYESFSSEKDITTEDRTQPDETGAVGPPVANAPTGGNDIPSNIKFRAYYNRIWAQIRSSWVPQGETSEASLLTVVGIRIAPNGVIEQSWIEKRSGNDYYDQSALRAIRKASPLPPLPEELSDKPLEVGINFIPQGLDR
ncbi:MAG: energy transducer TonB [bacterium]|nr:energy transducer TonB [bacterium]MDT8365844.1 energy transducer TonB [bacterium]